MSEAEPTELVVALYTSYVVASADGSHFKIAELVVDVMLKPVTCAGVGRVKVTVVI
jgi:hypothetical protein